MCKFNKISLFFKDVFLQIIQLDKFYTEDEIKDKIPYELKNEYYYRIVKTTNNIVFELIINSSDLFDEDIYSINSNKYLTKKSKRIIKYLGILDFLSYSDYVDLTLDIDKEKKFISYSSIIAKRIYEITIKFLQILTNEKNQLICSFLLRDIIESIKLYLYFICGSKSENQIENKQGKFTFIHTKLKVEQEIIEKLSICDKNWDFDIKKIIDANKSLDCWKQDLNKIKKINDSCNNIIHKNGLKKLLPQYVNYQDNQISIDSLFLCIKLLFSLVTCYDCKEISSSDYLDSLDLGEEPPEGCQYWVSPICKDFIQSEYSESEIKKLRDNTYMDI